VTLDVKVLPKHTIERSLTCVRQAPGFLGVHHARIRPRHHEREATARLEPHRRVERDSLVHRDTAPDRLASHRIKHGRRAASAGVALERAERRVGNDHIEGALRKVLARGVDRRGLKPLRFQKRQPERIDLVDGNGLGRAKPGQEEPGACGGLQDAHVATDRNEDLAKRHADRNRRAVRLVGGAGARAERR
jgi:hypothetical protein